MLLVDAYAASLGLAFGIIGFAWLVLPHCRRDNVWLRSALMLVVIVLSWRYIAWRFTDTIPPLAFEVESLVAWGFASLEALAMLSATIAAGIITRTSDRSAEASRFARWWGEAPPRIDVYIATYNEDADVLSRTIAGALATNYPDMRIFVLDDGRRSWLRDLCAHKGVGYITRPDDAHAKAGNINNAFFQRCDAPDAPDFIAVLDADFVPHQRFLERAVALFHDPSVAIVQTPQYFFNPDPIQHNLGVTAAYPDEQRFFFNHIQPARHAWNIAICCGTSSLVRTSALIEIGGFPTESVTEDFLISLRFAERGYRTVYLGEPLSEGLAAEGLPQYITQRTRWCLGMMQIVRGPYNPFSLRHRLNLRHRISILDSLLFWSTTFSFRIASIVVPLLYWYFGILAVDARVEGVLAYFVPAYAASLAVLNWLSRGLVMPFITDVAQMVAAGPITRAVWTGLLKGGPHAFKVTDKGGATGQTMIQWGLMMPFAALLAITIGGLCLPLINDYSPAQKAGDGIVVILFWTLYNVVVLGLAVMVCIEPPRPAHTMRRRIEAATVRAGERALACWASEIGPGTARLRGVSGLPADQPLRLEIDGVGAVRAEVAEHLRDGCRLSLFPDDSERDLLIRKLHTGGGAPGCVSGNINGLVIALGERLFVRTTR